MRGVHKRVRTSVFPGPPPPIISLALPLASFCWVFGGGGRGMVSKSSPLPPPPLPSTARGKMGRILIKPRPECVPSAPTQQLAALKTSGGLGNSMWGGGVRVWQQQGARGGGRGQAEGTRARGGLLGQNQEAGQSGHIPFPLADELSIQNAGEGRERHLFLIGGSNEHAESVPVVG